MVKTYLAETTFMFLDDLTKRAKGCEDSEAGQKMANAVANKIPYDFSMSATNADWALTICNALIIRFNRECVATFLQCYLDHNKRHAWDRDLAEKTDFISDLLQDPTIMIKKFVYPYLSGKYSPADSCILTFRDKRKGKMTTKHSYLHFDTDNPFIVSLLKDYLQTRPASTLRSHYRLKLFTCFADSLSGCTMPKCINDFNNVTFEAQENYFFGIHKYTETECKAFYIYIISRQNRSHFWLSLGIHELYLLKPHFYEKFFTKNIL